MKNEIESGWAEEEFADVDLGDKRRNQRLVHLCGRLSKAPESAINQACEDWSETKAAYRFFQNEGVNNSAIMSAHREKTVGRTQGHETTLAIQNSSYFSLSERDRRAYVAVEAYKPGSPGVVVVVGLFGMSTETIKKGRDDLDSPELLPPPRTSATQRCRT